MDNEKDLFKEYKSFLMSKEISVPKSLKSSIFHHINKLDAVPTKSSILVKFFVSQLLVGILALLFCPQLKFSLTHDIEIFHYIHHTYGENACSFICGLVFLGIGSLFGISILTSQEIKQIKNTEYLIFGALAALFACSFIVFGFEKYSGSVLIWTIGAYLGLLGGFQINIRIREVAA